MENKFCSAVKAGIKWVGDNNKEILAWIGGITAIVTAGYGIAYAIQNGNLKFWDNKIAIQEKKNKFNELKNAGIKQIKQ